MDGKARDGGIEAQEVALLVEKSGQQVIFARGGRGARCLERIRREVRAEFGILFGRGIDDQPTPAAFGLKKMVAAEARPSMPKAVMAVSPSSLPGRLALNDRTFCGPRAAHGPLLATPGCGGECV